MFNFCHIYHFANFKESAIMLPQVLRNRSALVNSYKAQKQRVETNSDQKQNLLSDKEQCFEDVLLYAKKCCEPNATSISTDSWIKICINAKTGSGKDDDLPIKILAHNDRSVFYFLEKTFPTGFQKALAIGFIMKNGPKAFKPDLTFNFAKFVKEISDSSLLDDGDKLVIRENIDENSFKDITLKIGTLTVSFGTYKNILKLPDIFADFKDSTFHINSRADKAPDKEIIADFIQWSISVAKTVEDKENIRAAAIALIKFVQ